MKYYSCLNGDDCSLYLPFTHTHTEYVCVSPNFQGLLNRSYPALASFSAQLWGWNAVWEIYISSYWQHTSGNLESDEQQNTTAGNIDSYNSLPAFIVTNWVGVYTHVSIEFKLISFKIRDLSSEINLYVILLGIYQQHVDVWWYMEYFVTYLYFFFLSNEVIINLRMLDFINKKYIIS